jgi:hypothetical protein
MTLRKDDIMTVIERLKMELQKTYLTDAEYIVLLSENTLTDSLTYNKATMQANLLQTVIDVLEVVSNDLDIMRRVETEFATTNDAYNHLRQRIEDIKDKIISIPATDEEYSPFSLLFTKNRY